MSIFHTQSLPELLQHMGCSEKGLSTTAAEQRLIEHGPNKLPDSKPRPAYRRFLAQFQNVLIYVLVVSGGITIALQHYLDAGVIFGVVIINAIIGFIQEGKAEAALRAIRNMVRTQCKVRRDGVWRTLDSEVLVPGDVVLLQSGDRLPADVRLFQIKDLRCDESALTGESQPVSKAEALLAKLTPLAEHKNMGFAGTLVTYGSGLGLVVATGRNTELGNIGELVRESQVPQTPLTRKLQQFALQLTYIIIALSAATMLFGVWVRHYDWATMFQAAVGIAVAAIPEGLPAVVTITLAIGVQRMARSHALVRKLPSVEVLGSVSVICSDKTGTLTKNEMTAKQLVFADGRYPVSGEGYGDAGSILDQHDHPLPNGNHPGITLASRIALLCNTATVIAKDDQWHLSGDPTEGALVSLALKAGQEPAQVESDWPRNDMLPFESERRYMASLHHNHEGEHLILVKGGPDRLLPFCTQQFTLKDGIASSEALNTDYWNQQVQTLAEEGLRIMALAFKAVDAQTELCYADAEQGLTLLAIVGITDPARPEAIDAIAQCHRAGICVKMITGDNPHTAAAIAKQLGLNTQRVVCGAELDTQSPEQFNDTVINVDVYARTSPEHKLRIVEALQAQRHIVAMTGDGVNDAPALRRANIGVAMGNKGTDAAKDASDIVLTDDNFATIAAAVREGRTVYDNIIKAILFILPTSLAEASVITLAILFGQLLPITPAQILWVNMITAITLAMALGFESGEPAIMQKAPRSNNLPLLNSYLIERLLFVGALGTVIVFGLFYYALQLGADAEKARTLAVNALVFFEIFYLFNCRSQQPLWQHPNPFGGKPVWIAVITVVVLQLGFTYLPGLTTLFQSRPLSIIEWGWVLGASSSVLLLVELEKWLVQKYRIFKARHTRL